MLTQLKISVFKLFQFHVMKLFPVRDLTSEKAEIYFFSEIQRDVENSARSNSNRFTPSLNMGSRFLISVFSRVLVRNLIKIGNLSEHDYR